MRAAAGLVVGLVCSTVLAGAAGPRTLTFEDRVKAQRAIEQVYWNHRIWPKDNPSRKPALDSVMSDALIRSKVTDYLKKSSALGTWWQRPITGEQLQAELERMAKSSRDPQVLHELFAALGNDPYVIAETLARQALADRLIRNWYANDTTIHRDTRAKVAAELASCSSTDCMSSIGGEYRETTLKLRDLKDIPQRDAGHDLILDSTDWNAAIDRLARAFGVTPDSIPLGKLTDVDETPDAFVVRAVLARKETALVTAAVVWPKRPFDAWWAAQDTPSVLGAVDKPMVFKLPQIAAGGCLDDTWAATHQDLPDPRLFHTAVWTGTEMIVWAGDNIAVELNTGGRYNPSTDSWAATSMQNVPDARESHSAVWTGTEMIVWGGVNLRGVFNTGGRYDPSADTWKATSTGTGVPSARSSHPAVWTGTEMIVWGGTNDGSGGRYNPSNDSWLPTSTGANAPGPRFRPTAVWTGTKMIVWGGWAFSGSNEVYPNTGGLYDPTSDSWVPTSVGAQVPIGRAGHSAVWTGANMIVWGGYNPATDVVNSGGLYDPSTDTWTSTSAGANLPAARSEHSALWTGTEMIVWGGSGRNGFLNSGGRYDPAGNSWRPTSTGANVPSARYGQSGVWSGREMIIWGGASGSYPFSLTWQNSGARYDPVTDTWVPTSRGQTAPTARVDESVVWTGAESCIWGGYESDSAVVVLNTGGCYDPSTDDWKPTAIDVNTPGARQAFRAVWTGTEMIVWGGYDLQFRLDTGGRYSPIANAWTATSRGANLPAARNSHTAVWTGAKMIIWGGGNSGGYLNSGGLYDPTTDSWSPTSIPTGEPIGRAGHTAVWTGTEMIVWGGTYADSGYHDINSGGRYNPSTDRWAPTSLGVNVPATRTDHTAVWTGREMIIWGGTHLDTCFNTGGRYNPLTDTWTATSTDANVPEARIEHTAVWSGLELIVWGGRRSDGGLLNSGGRYNPVSDAWLPTRTDATTPSERYLQSGVWTGNRMFVWGGYPFSTSGGLYCAHNDCFDDAGPLNCDDGNPCTDDSCDSAKGCIHVDNAAPCDDGNVCTSNDTCSEGRCIGHSGCEDGLPCTDDRADPANGCVCSNPISAPGTTCIDGNLCTVRTICDGNGGEAANCGGGTLLDCDDSNPCTDDACAPAIGCVHTDNTSACDDGLACTTADTCGGGSCHGGPPRDCNDGNICTDDSCNDATGCFYTDNGNACDDGNACNGPDSCNNGNCQHFFPLHCNDFNPCTTDTCDPATGCVFMNNTLPCVDGNACTTGDACGDGTCHAGTPLDCDDNNPCTFDDCDPQYGCQYRYIAAPCDDGDACSEGDRCINGSCHGTTSVVCNDDNACTNDSCDPATGCVFSNNANACDDLNPCTSGDACGGGVCRGTAVADGISCSDANACTAGDVCSNGNCHGTPIVCDDSNPCTVDTCNPFTGCDFINNTNACDDGNACTVGDRCGPPPGSQVFAENFDRVTGSALPTGWTSSVEGPGYHWVTSIGGPDTPPNSAFGRESTFASDTVLMTPPIAITSPNTTLTFRNRWSFDAPCFDAGVLEIKMGTEAFADVVTAGGSFISGGYTGTVESFYHNPLANRAAWCGISPGYPAYITTRVLLPANIAGQTIQLRWRLGSDSSSSVIGQDIDSIVIGDPTNVCNGGPAADCDDGNPCTDDSCNPASGCVHTNNTSSCNDGNACTSGDTCAGGSCHGMPIDCNDGNDCTTSTCNPATGCVFSNMMGSCDDGNACTTNDTCGPRQYFAENFDGVAAPALTAGWTSVVVGTGAGWVTRTAGDDTAPNSVFGTDSDQIADEVLETPAIAIATATARLTFRNRWSLDDVENCYDAGVLEIKIGAGSYTDIVAAGGSFVSGGYTGTVSADYGNPLANRSAWCNTSSGYPDYLTTAVNLPVAAAGQTIRLRWRLGSDISAAAVGQDIDSVVISEAQNVCTGGPARNCDDNNPCTDDSCNPATGCVHTSNTNPCSDTNACTSGDICSGGTCHGNALNCDDGNPCTDDSCNPATGCVHTNSTNSCGGGNACTGGGVCGGGTCHAGTPVVCAPADACHSAGVCNPATGVCSSVNAPDGTACSDNNLCTAGDSCRAGICTPASNGLNRPRPQSAGYYKQLCDRGRAHDHTVYHGDLLTDADALCVAGLTATFDYLQTVDDICNVLEDDNDAGLHGGRHHGGNGNGPNGHDCDKAEDELIATALNICRARVCLAQDLDSHCHGNTHTTVGQSFADGDAILDNALRDQHTCNAARCELREINNGHALEMNSLVLSIENGKVRLTWALPVMDDGAATPSSYELWRRPMGSGDDFTKIGQARGLSFVDGTAGSAVWEYDVSAVMP